LENLKGRDHLDDLSIGGRVLHWMLLKQGGKMWTGFSWIRIGTIGVFM